jgi:hypothetical protein
LPEVRVVARTRIPLHWVDGSLQWTAVLSRPWKWRLGIDEGELRAEVSWARVLAAAGVARGYEVFDMSDNQGVVCQLAAGRSSVRHDNIQLRRQAAYEAVGGFRIRTGWIPTHRQPGDCGTRTANGARLFEGLVPWEQRRTVVTVGWTTAHCSSADGLIGESHALPYAHSEPNYIRVWARRVMKQIESGYCDIFWWHWPRALSKAAAGCGDDTRDERLLRLCAWCLQAAISYGCATAVTAAANCEVWSAEQMQPYMSQNTTLHTSIMTSRSISSYTKDCDHCLPAASPRRTTDRHIIRVATTSVDLKLALQSLLSGGRPCGTGEDGLGGRIGLPRAVGVAARRVAASLAK